MSRRRQNRRAAKARRHAQPTAIVREATRAERLAYTRTQAAEALGVSRSTFNRRVLPYIETVEMPWGARLIPADELERLVAERRRPPRERRHPSRPPGRPAALAPEVVKRIRAERAAGKSLAQIARDLNASDTPTAHGGRQWWPSTVRTILARSIPPASTAKSRDARRRPTAAAPAGGSGGEANARTLPEPGPVYDSRSMTLRYQKEIVESWFDRGQRRSESTFDRFIYTWIALNAALSARFKVRRDREKLTIFAGELEAYWRRWLEVDSELREAALELAERSPIYVEPPRPDGYLEEVDVTADEPESVMLGVYAVRNNLFHGAKQFDVMRDHALVRTSTRIIERVFINSGLYDMANQPSRELTEPIGARDEGVLSARPERAVEERGDSRKTLEG